MSETTHLQSFRQHYSPKLPAILHDLQKLKTEKLRTSKRTGSELGNIFPKTLTQPKLTFTIDYERERTPLRVGVVLSGGQAAGGHNVISGLFDALKILHSDSQLFGFLNGPDGIINHDYVELTESAIADYRNQGGFDLIGSGRTKIETPEQFKHTVENVTKLNLDGLVVIGGDDSNTNAALLAEHFLEKKLKTRVIGVPKTIDGDLKNDEIEISFGFDTATKTFSDIIGNIARDSLSAKKYYFFIKMMGRSASHIALECALQTHPNLTLIGEEIERENKTFSQLTQEICDAITLRSEVGKNYGVILIPEGTIEFIQEFKGLIQELNAIRIDPESSVEQRVALTASLTPAAIQTFDSIPRQIQEQLLLDRDPHGNVQVSKIETERLFIEAVRIELERRKQEGSYSGKFSAQPLFCGYEGRSCLPSNFDTHYCYTLGHVAALLVDSGETGYMSCVKNLARPVEEWQICGIPLPSMIQMEMRKGKLKPVIRKALVDLDGAPFQEFKKVRAHWIETDAYRYPGPIQFFGPADITDAITFTLDFESQKFTSSIS